MDQIEKKPLPRLGYDYIAPPFLPEGQDEYYLRNQQLGPARRFRNLKAHEIEVLVKNANHADDWADIKVSDAFDPRLVRNCHFHGLVRIGALHPYYLEYHQLKLPVGLYHSTIVSCDIGDNVVIKNVDYLAHYIIGDEAILFNINEMQNTSHSKFGNGILKEGEDETVRIWLEICNENAGRRVLPFDGMLCADAWLWSKFRGKPALMERFREMVEADFDARRGYYGTVGEGAVIKNSRILKDVKVGPHAYIKGANKLKNLTINSSAEAPSQIGEGVEMVNGIMGYGSRSFYGVKAVRFVMGENTTLKYGARLINSYLGDNSTISCCEVLNSLIFPAHEQHHNNSFLIAATVLGQSNIAAGATLGSNHNSRGMDGEIVAGRGFWPGLSASLKHNSKFASYCLLAKGAYPAELHIPYPFALVSNHESENCLHIMPAYWWHYNMYALARNAWKYAARDQRIFKAQAIHFDFLAPDTAEELFQARELLAIAVAKAFLRQSPPAGLTEGELPALGRRLLEQEPETVALLTILGEGIENSRREARILKAPQAYQAYGEMLHFYAVKTLLDFGAAQGEDWAALRARFAAARREPWANLGGQLVRQSELERLIQKIIDRELASWAAVHDYYGQLESLFPEHNAAYAFAALLKLHGLSPAEADEARWAAWREEARRIAHLMARRTRESREKDFTNPFQQLTYDSPEELQAVLGDSHSFIDLMEEQARRFGG
jgi:NDP-sugar pyrophosphorylase family protein